MLKTYVYVYFEKLCSFSADFKTFYMNTRGKIFCAIRSIWQNFISLERHWIIFYSIHKTISTDNAPFYNLENGATISQQSAVVTWLLLAVNKYTESLYIRIVTITLLILHQFQNFSYGHKSQSCLHYLKHLAHWRSNGATLNCWNIPVAKHFRLITHSVSILIMVVQIYTKVWQSSDSYCPSIVSLKAYILVTLQ